MPTGSGKLVTKCCHWPGRFSQPCRRNSVAPIQTRQTSRQMSARSGKNFIRNSSVSFDMRWPRSQSM